MSTSYHESGMSEGAKDVHRALASLQEELEAVDWYQQRADTTSDDELREILIHNMNEEIEHASMLLEYLRRKGANFDEQLRTYLFTEKPITAIEENEADEAEGEAAADDGSLGLKALR